MNRTGVAMIGKRPSAGASLQLLLLLACSAGPQVGGTHVDDAPAMVPEEEMRVGSVEDPDAGFSRISAVEVDADGLLYVLESQDRQVRVYDNQGRLIRRIGREGAGPGEFRNPTLIGLQRDTLAISDLALGRVTLFLRTGQLLETVPTPPVWIEPAPGVYMMVAPTGFTRDGFSSRIVRMVTPPEVPRDSFAVPHVVLDRTGQIADTLRFERWSLVEPGIRLGNLNVTVPSGPAAGPLYIDGREDRYVVHRPTAASASGAAFTVVRLTGAGDTIYRKDIRYRPSTFTAEVVDSLIGQAVRPHLRSPSADSAAIAAAIRQAMRLPPYQPPIARGRLGADGVLWLQLNDEDRERQQWILLDQNGQIYGRVSLPRSATIHWSSGDRVVTVVRDDFDVPWLVRYRLHRRQ